MNTIIEPDILTDYSINQQTGSTAKKELGQDDFMKLMLEQLRNQDPFKPTENGEFIAQMAQFSTVTGIEEMQKSLAELANSLGNYQALQSAGLVGHSVLVPSDTFSLDEDNTLEGVFEIESSTGNAIANIYSDEGELVRQINLGIHPAGENPFSWDGTLENGTRAEPGSYTIAVTHGSGENTVAADVMIKQKIDSVNFSTSNGEIILNTADGQSLKFSEVRQIH